MVWSCKESRHGRLQIQRGVLSKDNYC
jgi:hypothetical protein